MRKNSAGLMSTILVAGCLLSGGQVLTRAAGNPTIFVGFLAKLPGAASSGLQVQNLDASQPASITVDFAPMQGSGLFSVTRAGVPAGSAANYYLPNEASLPNGAFAATMSADRPLAAIARTDWSGGGAALVGNAMAGTEVALPGAFKGFGGLNTIAVIQNTDAARPATVEVAFHGREGVRLAQSRRTIGAGASIAIALETDAAFSPVPAGSEGGLFVQSAMASVVVHGFVTQAGNPKPIYGYEGWPVAQTASRLYAPMIRSDFYGTTVIGVLNTTNASADITVTYTANPLTPACTGQRVHGGKAFRLPPKGSATFGQAFGSSLPTGDSGLPAKCLGSAVVEASGGALLGVVVDRDAARTPNSPGNGTAAAYRAFSDADGAKKVALPLYRFHHTAWDLSTGVQAMNIGPVHANASLAIVDQSGKARNITGPFGSTIGPGASFTWYPFGAIALPANLLGSATITSDQPIVVIVNDAASDGRIDSAIYSGIKAD